MYWKSSNIQITLHNLVSKLGVHVCFIFGEAAGLAFPWTVFWSFEQPFHSPGSLFTDSVAVLYSANISDHITVTVIITWPKLILLFCSSMECDFSINPLCPPMEREKRGEEGVMAVCVPVGSTWLWELIWPCAVSILLWDRGICLRVSVHCHGNRIKQLAAHFIFQVSVYQWSRSVSWALLPHRHTHTNRKQNIK